MHQQKDSLLIEDDFSFKDLIISITNLIKYLKQKIKFIIVAGLICSVLGLIYSIITPTEYSATTSFYLEESKAGGSMGQLSVLKQIGFGGGSGLDEDKLLKILNSRKIITSALLTKVNILDNNDILAHHLLSIINENDEPKINILEISQYERDSTLSSLHSLIQNDYSFAKKEEDGIIYYTTLSTNEEFSRQFNIVLIEKMQDFFIRNSILKETNNLVILENRLDSVRKALLRLESNLAKSKDRHLQIFKFQGRKDDIHLIRNIEILNLMYQELVKNIEFSRFNILLKTPVIQIIDSPTLPITKVKTRKLIGIIVGGIIGGLIAIFYFILILVYNKVMED